MKQRGILNPADEKFLEAARLKAFGQAPPSSPAAEGVRPEQPKPASEPSVPELREQAARCMQRGLWEASETMLTKLLQKGEPPETVIPDLVTAMVNAHVTLTESTRTRIEQLLADIERSGHLALAAQLRQQHAAELNPSQKKPWWKPW